MTGVLPPERRRPLLQAAAAEFAAVGYERASLNRVIRSQGMSKSSFYHYFDSKEALFGAVVTDIGALLVEALEPPSADRLAEGDFWADLMALAGRAAELARDRPSFMDYARLFYLPDAPRAAGSPLAEASGRVDEWIDRMLTVGRSTGSVGMDLPISLQRKLLRSVLWTLDEWSIEHMDDYGTQQFSGLASAQLAAVKRLFAPPASGEPQR